MQSIAGFPPALTKFGCLMTGSFTGERRQGKVVRYDTEPGTNFWQRAGLRFVSVLPIEWLL